MVRVEATGSHFAAFQQLRHFSDMHDVEQNLSGTEEHTSGLIENCQIRESLDSSLRADVLHQGSSTESCNLDKHEEGLQQPLEDILGEIEGGAVGSFRGRLPALQRSLSAETLVIPSLKFQKGEYGRSSSVSARAHVVHCSSDDVKHDVGTVTCNSARQSKLEIAQPLDANGPGSRDDQSTTMDQSDKVQIEREGPTADSLAERLHELLSALESEPVRLVDTVGSKAGRQEVERGDSTEGHRREESDSNLVDLKIIDLFRAHYDHSRNEDDKEEKRRDANEDATAPVPAHPLDFERQPGFINRRLATWQAPDINANITDWQINFQELVLHEKIGIGGSSQVFRGSWNGTPIAVKRFYGYNSATSRSGLRAPLPGKRSSWTKRSRGEGTLKEFRDEVTILSKLRHPNLVLFMGFCDQPPNLCVVAEYVRKGSLFRWLAKKGPLEVPRQLSIAISIARGMTYLHRRSPPILHHDLKSANILVDDKFNAKICDFGLAKVKHHSRLLPSSGSGTPQWMAPEVLLNEAYDESSDVYSFGVILWELMSGKEPWEKYDRHQITTAVAICNQRLDIPAGANPILATLAEDCWLPSEMRPTFHQVLSRLQGNGLQHRYTSL